MLLTLQDFFNRIKFCFVTAKQTWDITRHPYSVSFGYGSSDEKYIEKIKKLVPKLVDDAKKKPTKKSNG